MKHTQEKRAQKVSKRWKNTIGYGINGLLWTCARTDKPKHTGIHEQIRQNHSDRCCLKTVGEIHYQHKCKYAMKNR
jgi:hypothetical protein